jgi:hypothetical protein
LAAAVDRIASDCVALAQVIEQSGERRELAVDAGSREPAPPKILRQAIRGELVTVSIFEGC